MFYSVAMHGRAIDKETVSSTRDSQKVSQMRDD